MRDNLRGGRKVQEKITAEEEDPKIYSEKARSRQRC